ncbi:MAG: hypothetical protein KDD92_09350 [Caldilineaceae bacterium]|nr:hypothetical protein [Caldilineaceae bacterium]
MPDKLVKACVDRRPERLPFALGELIPAAIPTPTRIPPEALEAALVISKKWPTGRVLTCTFMDGEEVVQRKVAARAHVWSRYGNIRFKFVDTPDADIRISFQQQGSWSYIGTDAQEIPADEPTMNFGWLYPNTHNDEYDRVVIHEFGHALGLIHEHQNPSKGIPWDKDAVYDYYQGPPNNWTREQVDINLFQKYAENLVRFTGFDTQSIMLYPVPNEFTIGDFEVGWNRNISTMDADFIGRMYPKPSNEILLDAPPRSEAISQLGEIDTFTFLIFEPGTYAIETHGRTDLVMTLYGPDNDTQFIDLDDDSGRRLNPRLVKELDWGLYTVRIQHFSRERTGDYQIGVSTVTE